MRRHSLPPRQPSGFIIERERAAACIGPHAAAARLHPLCFCKMGCNVGTHAVQAWHQARLPAAAAAAAVTHNSGWQQAAGWAILGKHDAAVPWPRGGQESLGRQSQDKPSSSTDQHGSTRPWLSASQLLAEQLRPSLQPACLPGPCSVTCTAGARPHWAAPSFMLMLCRRL